MYCMLTQLCCALQVWMQQNKFSWRESPTVADGARKLSLECQDLLDKVGELGRWGGGCFGGVWRARGLRSGLRMEGSARLKGGCRTLVHVHYCMRCRWGLQARSQAPGNSATATCLSGAVWFLHASSMGTRHSISFLLALHAT